MTENVVKRVSAIFTVKDDGYNKSLADINKQMKLTQSEIKLAGERLKAFGNTTVDLKYKQEALTQQIQNVKDKISLYNKSIEDTTNKLNRNKEELIELGKKKDELKNRYKEAIKVYGAESKEVQELSQELEKAKEAYKEKEQVIKTNINTLNTHQTSLKNTETELVRLQGELKKTSIELTTNESKWIKAGKALESAGEKMKNFGSKVSSAGNTLTLGVTTPIVGIGIAATKMAMEAVESENLFEVSMGKMAGAARQWSEQLRKELGLNAFELRKNVGTFNAMLSSMGMTEKQAYQMSTTLTKLAYDMASFYNLDPTEAFDKLRAGISGEAEPLKALGILVNDNTIKTYAYTHGIAKQGKELTEQQKVLARYGVIMEQTKKAQGDLARTLDSPTNKLRVQKEQLKQTAIELGQKLIPLLNKGMDILKPIVDYISNLNDEQKEIIIKMGMIAAAAGPVLSISGKFISIGGSIVGTVGKISSSLGKAKIATEAAGAVAGVAGGAGGFTGLASGLGAAAAAALPWVAGAAAVALAGYGIYKGLTKETVPAVNLFADKVETTAKTVGEAGNYMNVQYETTVTKISESTKKAVGAYMELDNSAKEKLNSLYVNSTVITDQIKNDTVSKFNEMKNQVIAGYEQQKNDSIAKLKEMFTNMTTVTATEQQNILKQTIDYYEGKKALTSEYEKKIQAIMAEASAQKRALTADEVKSITDLQNKMREEAVKALSQNEIEAQIILQRMKDYDGRITTEMAAQHIKKLNESRDKAVQAANEEYEKRVALIIRMRDEAKSISAEQADKMIAEAKRQRDGIVQKAEETRLEALDKMRQLNKDLDKEVDTGTGKILTWWDKLKRWWSGWQPERKTFSYSIYERKMGGYSPEFNALGTNYFQGGLTYINEKGYELVDLPRGTKIFNHEASERYVRRTAEEVAKSIVSSIGSIGGEKTIIVPVYLEGREVARATAPYISEELEFDRRRKSLAYGGGY